jgi:hypothetical protein
MTPLTRMGISRRFHSSLILAPILRSTCSHWWLPLVIIIARHMPGGRYVYLQHNYERHFINEPTDFIANFIPISYCFHFHISISLGFFISYLEQSHSDFHTYPNAFIRIFHSPTLGISLKISYSLAGTFNEFFIAVA